MEEKLQNLFKECILELQSIGIDCEDKSLVGEIDISIAKRKTKRYGCCKQEMPDKTTKYYSNRKILYKKFLVHHIEISKWLMDLNDDIIKNTIIHELIHCLPDCNNHGMEFKKYAKIINSKLNYNITRVGDKKEDYKKSNIDYIEEEKKHEYNYIIKCEKCDQIFYRKRLLKNFSKRYRCGKCGGKFIVTNY